VVVFRLDSTLTVIFLLLLLAIDTSRDAIVAVRLPLTANR